MKLIDLLIYDPATGSLVWSETGAVATRSTSNGYLVVRFKRGQYLAHRLIWEKVNGSAPTRVIDHIDGDKKNNRIENLRECSQRDNCKNQITFRKSSSIRTGVCYAPREQKYRAYINVNRRQFTLGYHDTVDQAIAARLAGEERHFGQYAPRGR